MNKIRVRLLGGFEVWCGDRQVTGFESQKVRALLAYLVCHRGRAFTRDHLAGLLWPEKDPDAARHTLRQAIYNLRSTLGDGGGGRPPVASNHLDVSVQVEADLWLDVAAFEEALRWKGKAKSAAPQDLAAAAQLYRGEFLTGFHVKDSPDFEDWLIAEQERLREAAIEVHRKLIESYQGRGEYRFGVHYARRLVAIEPLSEEARRDLMRLCSLAGLRSQALAQYEALQELLRSELAVEPMVETRALYEAILADAPREAGAAGGDGEPIGPLVPLAGRGDAFAALRLCWQQVLEGRGRITLVEGEAGVGKTRLIKSFLDASTAQRRAVVLRGSCPPLAPPVPYRAWVEALANAVAEERERVDRILAAAPREVLEDLCRLLPDLRELRPEIPALPPVDGEEGRRRLFASVAHFLGGLGAGGRSADPVIVFFDDLQLADRETWDLLAHLPAHLETRPVWILAARRPAALERGHPIYALLRGSNAGTVSRLGIDRLDGAAVEEIAASLVGEAEARELTGYLVRASGCLPLAVTELINFLWDEGVLVARESGRWGLAGDLDRVALNAVGDLNELILRRIRRLPNSTRRLITLAAVAGQSFEAELLQEAADEHPGVVEIGLELLLKRWLVRQFVRSWASRGRERDIVLWERGARKGGFEFAHQGIRRALYQDINPLRRQSMHAQFARALERLGGGRSERCCEDLAHHFAAAGEWDRALPYLERAAERAGGLAAKETALHYFDRALEATRRLAGAARSEEQRRAWRGERERLQERRTAAQAL